jgi:hypothetical protein
VHVLDFTAMTAQPGVCQVVVQGRPSHPFRIAASRYEQLGRDALGLFYLLRSGCPIDGGRALPKESARPGASVS